MRVIFDYQAFALQTIGGVTRSMVELINGLGKEGVDCQLAVKESDNTYIKDSSLVHGLKPLGYRWNRWFGEGQRFKGEFRIKEAIFNAVGYNMDVNQEYCKTLLKKQCFDIFHPTYYNSYFLKYLKGKPFVLTVHDMMPELFHEYFKRDDFQVVQKKLLCPLAAKIHVPSYQTKNDLINILGIDPTKIHVIHHGYSYKQYNLPVNFIPVDFPYILYVGGRKDYKNFIPFVHELSNVLKKFQDLHLVCTGENFNKDENRLFHELGISDRILHIFATEAELQYLYKNAITFVYPSLYEGFGLPILEAYANKCPVMLNNTSCFPEIAGDAAIYFTLKNGKSDFYDKFIHLYQLSHKDRDNLINRQVARLSLFSWGKASKQMYELYKSIY